MQNIIAILNGIFVGGSNGGGGGGIGGAFSNAFSNAFSGGVAPAFSFGNALEFDGANDYVESSSFSDQTESQPLTVSIWIKGTTPTSAYQGIFTIPQIGGKPFIFLYSEGVGYTDLSYGYFSVSPSLTTRTVLDAGLVKTEWNHIFLTGTPNAGLSCYINGVLKTRTTAGSFGSSYTNTMRLGVYGASYGAVILDETAIWSNTLGTAQNALDLYNSGSGALASDVIASPTAYWRMNESGSATTAVDETGNYNGTLNNFPTSGMWVAH